MESYKFSLSSANPAFQIAAQGDLFVYESGAGATDTAETRVKIKPDTGGEILLRPGQRFRTPARTTQWNVTFVGPDAISGYFIVGEGDFDDANTKNSVKLDASFANNVTILNTTANRVPVSLDPNQSINAGIIVPYTHAYSSSANTSTAVALLPAFTNVNGAVLNRFDFTGGSSGAHQYTIVAKATAPASMTDGDVLFAYADQGAAQVRHSGTKPEDGQFKVAAGKGVWYVPGGADNCAVRSALFTVL